MEVREKYKGAYGKELEDSEVKHEEKGREKECVCVCGRERERERERETEEKMGRGKNISIKERMASELREEDREVRAKIKALYGVMQTFNIWIISTLTP